MSVSKNICWPSDVCFKDIVFIGWGFVKSMGRVKPVVFVIAAVLFAVYVEGEPILPILLIVVDIGFDILEDIVYKVYIYDIFDVDAG